jgi:hypothetical protein
MKSIKLYLVAGTEVTFYLSDAQSFVVIDSADIKNSCKLIDGIHNNGGWHIAESADSVNKKLNALFNPKPFYAGPG